MNDFARPIDIGSGGRVQYGLDDGLLVEFYKKPKLMEAVSEELGMPTYEDRVFTRIVAPGNTKTTWDYETRGLRYEYEEQEGKWPAVTGYEVDENLPPEQCDPIRFPKAWARFTKKGEKINHGWAIETWGAIPRSFAENLKAQNIHTVEALAGLSDTNAQNVMGSLKFRNLAKAALDEQAGRQLLSAEQERANKAEEDKKQMQAQIDGLKAQIQALSETKKGKAA